MFEIRVKTDDHNAIAISQNGELISIHTKKQDNELNQNVDEILTPLDTSAKRTTVNNKKQHKKHSMENFIYDHTRYIKLEDLFLRVFPDDICEKIASSTYYKYKGRKINEE